MNTRLAGVAAVLLLAGAASAAERATVVVDLKTTVTANFVGAGVQWDPYEYPPSAEGWKKTRERVDYLRPGLIRVMLNSNSYWRGWDEAGNPKYAWDGLASLLAILDYAEEKGIDVMLGEWSPPRGMTPADPRWARLIADFLAHLRETGRGRTIRWYNLMNEPNGGWMWPGGKVDYEAWATGIGNLRAALDAHGLERLPIAGPDNSGNWEWLDRCAREQAARFGAWEMHWYAKDADVLSGGIEKLLAAKRDVLLKEDPAAASKPRFLGEAGLIEGKINGDQQPRVKTFEYGVLMADYFAQVARAGWQGAIAWDLDDAMHAVRGGHRPTPPDELTLKVWGFWNSQGTAMGRPEDEGLRPWFYTWSLMSRLFPKGAQIVAASGSAGLRPLAASVDGGVSVMVVNEAATARRARVRVPGAGKRRLVVYRYFESMRPTDADGYPVAAETLRAADLGRGIDLDLPGRGVVFVSDRDGTK